MLCIPIIPSETHWGERNKKLYEFMEINYENVYIKL